MSLYVHGRMDVEQITFISILPAWQWECAHPDKWAPPALGVFFFFFCDAMLEEGKIRLPAASPVVAMQITLL